MNPQPHFRADLQVRQAHEHVKRVEDDADLGILERNNAVIDLAAVDLLEYRHDAADAHVFDVVAKAFDGGEMAVAVFGAEIGDLDDFLQGARAADDFAEDGADG